MKAYVLSPLTPAPWEPLTHPFRRESLGVLLWAFLFSPLKHHHLPCLLSDALGPLLLRSQQQACSSEQPPFTWIQHWQPRLSVLTQTSLTPSLSDFPQGFPRTKFSPIQFRRPAWAPLTTRLGAGVQRVLRHVPGDLMFPPLCSSLKAPAFLITCDAQRASSCWAVRLPASDGSDTRPFFLSHSPRNYVPVCLPGRMFSPGE